MWPRSNLHSCPEISGDPYSSQDPAHLPPPFHLPIPRVRPRDPLERLSRPWTRRSARRSAIAGTERPESKSTLPRRDPGGRFLPGRRVTGPIVWRVPRYREKPPEQMRNQWVKVSAGKIPDVRPAGQPLSVRDIAARGLGFARL